MSALIAFVALVVGVLAAGVLIAMSVFAIMAIAPSVLSRFNRRSA